MSNGIFKFIYLFFGIAIQTVPVILVQYGLFENTLIPVLSILGVSLIIIFSFVAWNNGSSGWILFYTILTLGNTINWSAFAIRSNNAKENNEDDPNVLPHWFIWIGMFLILTILVLFVGWNQTGKKPFFKKETPRLFTPHELRAREDCIDNFGGVENVRQLGSVLDLNIRGKRVGDMSDLELQNSNVCDQIVFRLSDVRNQGLRLSGDQTVQLENIVHNVNNNALTQLIEDVGARSIEKGTLAGNLRRSQSSLRFR